MKNPLADQLKSIGLHHIGATVDDLIALATKHRWTHAQLLERIVEMESQDRARKGLERRLRRSRIGRFKAMADFNWSWPKRIDRAAVEAALKLDFLDSARNVVLVAPQGLGKTMIAKNIAYQAIVAGKTALFTTAAQMLLDLGSRDSARALDRRLKHYSTVGLLCVDEIGYLSYDARNADLLFEVITRRYENRSLVLTTNLAFSDWPTIFPNATCAIALIDRAIHHADIIPIEGESYRRREAETAKKARKTKAAA
jgi:DNA replication protein DnaC